MKNVFCHLPMHRLRPDPAVLLAESGEDAIVAFWPERNFEGDPTVHEAGAREPSIDEPRSLKIEYS